MGTLAEASAVTKAFGSFTAVSRVDIAVGSGEIVGLLGANGAGKTTLIRLLLGLTRPSGGSVRLLGSPPSTGGRRLVGYVPQTLGLYAGLTAGENWDFAASAFRVAGTALPAVISARKDELVARLPLGEQRRVAFAIALSHHPELLVLDEPTSGVGPLGSVRLWEEIRQAAAGNAGVLVTTHAMEEAEQCDRLVIMSAGKVVAEGTTEEITSQRTAAEVRCGEPARAFTLLDADGFAVQLLGSTLRVAGSAPAVAARLSKSGIEATVDAVPANLEEVFADIVARKEAR